MDVFEMVSSKPALEVFYLFLNGLFLAVLLNFLLRKRRPYNISHAIYRLFTSKGIPAVPLILLKSFEL
jgi:hypothetical protein